MMIRSLCLACLIAVPVCAQSVSDILTLTRQGRLAEARQMLTSMESSGAESHLFLHGLLCTDGDSAAAYYDKLIKTDKNNPYSDLALFRLGQLSYAKGLYHQSLQLFNSLIRIYPSSTFHPRTFYQIGMCHSALNQPDSALHVFQKIRNEYPHSDVAALAGDVIAGIQHAHSEDGDKQPVSFRFSVQVGAFTRHSNALLRKSFFENKGYEVALRTKTVNNQLFYLVWVGSYASQEEARSAGESLKRRFDIQYTLVSEELQPFPNPDSFK
ncbi:MAG TPA: tetratricopeptide repeat protein [bacterium]|nr:tetratricopeptide repeat protein [bacterium]